MVTKWSDQERALIIEFIDKDRKRKPRGDIVIKFPKPFEPQPSHKIKHIANNSKHTELNKHFYYTEIKQSEK